MDIGITGNFGAALDLSQYFSDYGLGAKTTPFIFVAGPRAWLPVGTASKVRSFADFLAGAAFIQTGRTDAPLLFKGPNTFAWSAGGGVDVRGNRPPVDPRAGGIPAYPRLRPGIIRFSSTLRRDTHGSSSEFCTGAEATHHPSRH